MKKHIYNLTTEEMMRILGHAVAEQADLPEGDIAIEMVARQVDGEITGFEVTLTELETEDGAPN